MIRGSDFSSRAENPDSFLEPLQKFERFVHGWMFYSASHAWTLLMILSKSAMLDAVRLTPEKVHP